MWFSNTAKSNNVIFENKITVKLLGLSIDSELKFKEYALVLKK